MFDKQFKENLETGQRMFAGNLLLVLNNQNLSDEFKLAAIRKICEDMTAKDKPNDQHR